MGRLARILKHRWLDETDVARALDGPALTRLEQHVARSENRHSGEIRLCIEAGLPLSYLWRHASARQRAVTMFGKLRVWDTEHNNGVLIYLLFAERDVEIVADRGFNNRIAAAQWEAICRTMEARFVKGEFEAGLTEGINTIGDLLREHFPADMGENEQSDRPMIV